jgi:hypothetical protein
MTEKGEAPKNIKVVLEGVPADDPRLLMSFDPAKRDDVYNLIKKEFWTLRLAGEKPGELELGLSSSYRVDVRERTISQSIEVIRNRIDEFGVSEPAITSQGADRIVVELPGVKEVDRAKDLIGRTARLEFKMVDDKAMSQAQLQALVAEIEKSHQLTYKEGQKFSEYVAKINQLAKGKIPEGDEIAFERSKAQPGQPAAEATVRIPYLLHSKVDLTGDDLQDAQVQIDQENRQPNVGFTLNPRGAQVFDKLTGENVGHRMAIVLDGIVHSAPVIWPHSRRTRPDHLGARPGGRGPHEGGQRPFDRSACRRAARAARLPRTARGGAVVRSGFDQEGGDGLPGRCPGCVYFRDFLLPSERRDRRLLAHFECDLRAGYPGRS